MEEPNLQLRRKPRLIAPDLPTPKEWSYEEPARVKHALATPTFEVLNTGLSTDADAITPQQILADAERVPLKVEQVSKEEDARLRKLRNDAMGLIFLGSTALVGCASLVPASNRFFFLSLALCFYPMLVVWFVVRSKKRAAPKQVTSQALDKLLS